MAEELSILKKSDPEMYNVVQKEYQRQLSTLNLIASENYPSPAVLEAQSSIFYSKLAEGYPGKRFCAGCENVDFVENLARERAQKLFGADHANVQCVTATQANEAAYFALLKPGDLVLSMKLIDGAHFSHGSLAHSSGRDYRFVHYGVERKSEQIDYEQVEKMARENRPKLIIAGASAYSRQIDFKEFGRIAKSIDAFFMADIAHIAGLIAAKLHPDPVPYADVITSSTHKTLRGPRGGGLILCRKELAKKIDRGVFPGIQAAPVMNMIAARAVLYKEAMSEKFKQYQQQIILNGKALADELLKNNMRLVAGGTDNHLILIDLRELNITGDEAEKLLYSVGIVTNKNLIPFDSLEYDVTSGLRIGTPALTTRGMKEKEMRTIARLIASTLKNREDKPLLEKAKKEVTDLAKKCELFSAEWLD